MFANEGVAAKELVTIPFKILGPLFAVTMLGCQTHEVVDLQDLLLANAAPDVPSKMTIAVTHHTLPAQRIGVREWIIEKYYNAPPPPPTEPYSCAKIRSCLANSLELLMKRDVVLKEPFVEKLGIQDPIDRLQTGVLSLDVPNPEPTTVTLVTIPLGVKDPLNTRGAPFILHFETERWGIEAPMGSLFWSIDPYAVFYAVRVKLILVPKSQVLANHYCGLITPRLFTLKQLTDDEGEVFRRQWFRLVDFCADQLRPKLVDTINTLQGRHVGS